MELQSKRRLSAKGLLFFFWLNLLFFPVAIYSVAGAETGKIPVDLSTAIVQVAKTNIPAVVHIEVTERQEVENPMAPFGSDPFLRHFFNIPKMPKKFKRELRGLGSGMIIDTQGHILTNHHVVGGANKIEVLLSDGRRFTGKLVGSDPKTDLAVIRISGKESFPHVTFGDSDRVEVGEWVVAIGHPRGLDQTVTQGIISAKHRRGITDPSSYQDFMQTDAAINPGNSGGPLLNLKGEVVGINSAIASESGGFEGIGFTIPSNIAVHVAQAILAHGKVERGWLGITMRDVSSPAAEISQRRTEKGAVVVEVLKNGPADKAGLKKDDVIVEFNGRTVPDSEMLRNEVANTPVGREVKIVFLRKGQRLQLTFKVGNLESSTKMYLAVVKEKIGAEVRSLTPEEVAHFGLEAGRGVIITRLEDRGPLKKAGFELGDIILAVDQQPVEGVDGFIQIMEALKPKAKVTLVALDHRSGNVGTVVIGPIP